MKMVLLVFLQTNDCMELLNFDDIQSMYHTEIRDCNGTVEKGDYGTQFIKHTEAYIVNFPCLPFAVMHSGISILTYHSSKDSIPKLTFHHRSITMFFLYKCKPA